MSRRSVEQWTAEGGWLVELVLPRTDAGVAVQFVLVLMVGLGLVVWLRNRPDARLTVGGATFLLLMLMALRGLH